MGMEGAPQEAVNVQPPEKRVEYPKHLISEAREEMCRDLNERTRRETDIARNTGDYDALDRIAEEGMNKVLEIDTQKQMKQGLDDVLATLDTLKRGPGAREDRDNQAIVNAASHSLDQLLANFNLTQEEQAAVIMRFNAREEYSGRYIA